MTSMEWWQIILLLFGGMVFLLFTGLPVAFAFLVVNLTAAYFFLGGVAGLVGVVSGAFNSITTFTLLPVPFFCFMGELIFHSGVGLRAIRVIDDWLGRLPGRLSIIAVITGVIFAALSGSTIANTALLGTVLVPEMEKRGYSKGMTLGPIMGVGGVAMLIPPSALAVVLASLGGMDVGQLLIAGLLPGFVMGSLYLAYILVRCFLQPELAPSYHVEPIPLSRKLANTAKYSLPVLFIIFMVTGVIFLGIATPTEAAATGALGAFVVAVAYRQMSWEVMRKSMYGTVKVVGMIFMIIIMSQAYSEILAFTGAAAGLVDFAVGQKIAPLMIILTMMLTIILLGCFMETVSIMMITIPIFMPIVKALGFDPIWFGVLMMVNLELGMLTPPFGMLLFVMKGVSPKGTAMGDIYKAALPFIAVDILGLAILLLVPGISTYLPALMPH
jgi:tripartite ATP-independent transporter DctM subunit